jgi:WD40 repeat protein
LGDARVGFGQSWGCAFTPDGHRLLAVGQAGFRAWELEASEKPGANPLSARQLVKDTGEFRNLTLDPAGHRLAFCGLINETPFRAWHIFLRNLDLKGPAQKFKDSSWPVQSLGFVPGTDQLAFVSIEGQERELLLWDVASSEVLRKLPLLSPGERSTTLIANLRFRPDGLRFAIANHEGRRVNIYETGSGRRLYSLPDEPGVIWWLTWSPDGRQLAVARENGELSLWTLPEVETALAQAGLSP